MPRGGGCHKRAATIRPNDASQPRAPCITVIEPEAPAKVVELPPSDAVVIGRAENAHITVTHPTVSRRHALIRTTDAGAFIEDLGSSNGTQVNGAKLLKGIARPLASGDVVLLGVATVLHYCDSRHPKGAALSHRETDVVALIASGHTTKEVAQALGISARTVESYRQSAMARLGARNAAELIAHAMGRGLLLPAADATLVSLDHSKLPGRSRTRR